MKDINMVSLIKNEDFKTIIFDMNGTITGRVSNTPAHIAFRNKYIERKLNKSLHISLPDNTRLAMNICGLSCKEYQSYRDQNLELEVVSYI